MSSEADRPRHARGKSDWGVNPSRLAARDAVVAEQSHPEVVPQGKRPPGKKDPSLCKAAHWKGPHQPVLRMQEYGWRRSTACKWGPSWPVPDGEPSWRCSHEEVCKGCGKVLRISIEAWECPDFHPVTDEERAAIEAERVEHEARVAELRERNHWKPRPVITGPQGYRRKRED